MENIRLTKKITDSEKYIKDSRKRVSVQAEMIRKQILEDTEIWGPGESIRENEDCFDPISGSISLSEDDLNTDFFRNSLRIDISGESKKDRGVNYYIGINPLRDVKEKLSVIKQDIDDLKIALSKEGISWREKAGLLDYVKQHALTLYHAIQYPLRYGVNITSMHQQILENAKNTAIMAVSDFYNHLLGYTTNTDCVNLLDVSLQGAGVISPKSEYLKIQELDQPIVILGNGYGNAVTYKDTDVLIGLPSGGTQIAIVTQLCMNKHGLNPELAFVPLSTHSAKKNKKKDSGDMPIAHLEQLVAELNIKNKNVLVLEDNSNTGTTLSLISNAIEKQTPASLHVSIAELDPLRVHVKSQGKPIMATNIRHPDFSTAVSVVPITRNFLSDRQIRKAYAQKIVYRGLEAVEYSSITPLTETSYEQIRASVSFLEFEKKYKNILRYVGDKYNYRNPYMIALQLYRDLAPTEYKKNINTSYERYIISAISTAAIQYPFIPKILKIKLTQMEEVSEYEPGKFEPWMILGSRDMIDACFSAVKNYGGKVYIWTKGDSHRIGYEKLPGAGEQAKRFSISGLSESVKISMAKYELNKNHFEFLALPNKARVISEVICPDAQKANGSIFIIDDNLENIKIASDATRDFNINTETFLVENKSRTPSLKDATSFIQKINSPVSFVLDMDDTLLHEQFRKEHQPINIYLQMKNLGLLE